MHAGTRRPARRGAGAGNRGNLARTKVGRADKEALLAAARPGDDVEWVRDGDQPRPAAVPRAAVLAKHRTKSERAARHALVVGALEHFLHSRVSTYDDEKHLRLYKRYLVDVMSSKECLKRALDSASALSLTIEERVHS